MTNKYDPEKVEALIDAALKVKYHASFQSSTPGFAELEAAIKAIKPEPEMEYVLPDWGAFCLRKKVLPDSFGVFEVYLPHAKPVSEGAYNAIREATARPKQSQGKLPDEPSKNDLEVFTDGWHRLEGVKNAIRFYHAHLKETYNV